MFLPFIIASLYYIIVKLARSYYNHLIICGLGAAVCLYLCFPPAAKTQTRHIDSLKRVVYQANNGHEKLKAMLALCDDFQSLNRDTFDLYTIQVNSLARESGDERSISLAAIVTANNYYRWGWIDSAMAAIDPVIERSPVNRADRRDIYFKAGRQKALFFGSKSKYAEALEMLYQLVSDGEKYNDTLAVSSNMNSICSIELQRNEPVHGLELCRKALQPVASGKRFEAVRAAIYVNMAEAFNQLNKTDSAIFYSEMGVALFRKGNNLMSLALALQRQSGIYLSAKEVDKAANSLLEMIAVRKLLNDGDMWTDDNMSLINLYIEANEYDKAIDFCKKQLVSGNLYIQQDTARVYVNDLGQRILYYEALARCYRLKGDQSAYQAVLEQIILAKDSFYTVRSENAIAEVQTKYEVEQKENTIMHQELTIIRKNRLLLLVLYLALLVGAVIYLLFRGYRRKQKRKVTDAIEKEKGLSAIAVADAEENERRRIAADLHDNLGAYAASIASNLDVFNVNDFDDQYKTALQELNSNSRSIVSQLSDTIWALNRENLTLTAISDRIKLFLNYIGKSHANIDMVVLEEIGEDIELKSTDAFHLFRIIQEAVTNAVRHSKTSKLEIIFEEKSGWRVMIKDYGIGTSGSEVVKTGSGNGLRNMRSRAGMVGWSVTWSANVPVGTIVTIRPEDNTIKID
jgi:signal transduction histidine kinase